MPAPPIHIGVYDCDDDLIDATRRDRRPRVRVYPYASTAVVLGAGGRPEVELQVDCCIADGVPVLKRRGGGCAVVLDPGNVIVSAVLPIDGILGSRKHFERLSAWLIEGLARTGIEGVYREGTCDLVRGDRKVGGACIHRSRDVLYYSATLLVEPDLVRVKRYLRHPPREPDYRRGRSHAEFMGALSDRVPSGGAAGLAECLRRWLTPPVDGVGA